MFESESEGLLKSFNNLFWQQETDETIIFKLILRHKFGYSESFIEDLKRRGDEYYWDGGNKCSPPPPKLLPARPIKSGMNRSRYKYKVDGGLPGSKYDNHHAG